MSATYSSFNLASPNRIRAKCDLSAIDEWFESESQAIEDKVLRDIVFSFALNLDVFVRFPKRPLLLWYGCDRVPPEGKKNRYHRYPQFLKEAARRRQIGIDTRPNGPAIASFLFAGGERPERFGSTNAWSIHHLYSGKFPYIGRTDSLHGQKDGRHFTQSAGLIAVHPLADALSDEFPAFSWLLRAHAFQKFGYDPDVVFASTNVDSLGFAYGRSTDIFYND